jgi:putative ABC transport system permease protein
MKLPKPTPCGNSGERRIKMGIIAIALKNLKKNFSFYALYFVSVTFVLTVFFAFVSFSMNDIMMEKISSDGRVETMTNTISVFLMAFVLFYMSYSNKFFLRRRAKELGIYTMLGYRKSKIIQLLAFENIFVCLASFLSGVLLGALAHKGIVAGITKLLGLDIDNAAIPLFNMDAVTYAAAFVAAVIAFLSLSNILTVKKITLLELVRFDKKAEMDIKINWFWAICGVIFLLSGYLMAADILRGRDSLWFTIGFSPMALLFAFLITAGTVLSVRSFSPWFFKRAKNNKDNFYKATRIIIVPNFVYRIRTNAKTLIMLTFLIAGTLIATGTMALTLYYPIAAIGRIIPSEIEFRLENTEQADSAREIVGKYAAGAVFTQTTLISVPSSSKNLPIEYRVGSQKGDMDLEKIVRTPAFEAMSESDYVTLLRQQGRREQAAALLPLGSNDCILVKYEPNRDGSTERGNQYVLEAIRQITLSVKNTTLLNPIGFANSMATLIVPDEVYHELALSGLPITHVVSVNGKEIAGNDALYQELYTFLDKSPYLVSSSARTASIIHDNSSTFLLLGFLVVLFFIGLALLPSCLRGPLMSLFPT